MKSLFEFLIANNSYKVFVSLISFELTRGLFIVLFAWLLQDTILRGEIDLSLILVLIFRILIENFRNKFYIDLSLKLQFKLRLELHEVVFKEIKSGELLTLLFDMVKVFDEFFMLVLPNFLTIIVLIPLILIVTLISDPLTAMIFFVTLPIAPFLLYLIGNALKLKNQAALVALNDLNFNFKELLAAISTFKIFGCITSARSKLNATSVKFSESTLEVLKLAFVSAFALELITTLSIAIVAVTVGLRLIDNSINFDVALFLLILAPEFYNPIRQIGVTFHVIIRCIDALNYIKDINNRYRAVRQW